MKECPAFCTQVFVDRTIRTFRFAQGSVLKILLRLFLTILIFGSFAAHAKDYEGVVVKITDGDTVTVLDSEKKRHDVRLAGIDAPERHQAFGQRSKQSLSDLVYLQRATVHFQKEDRYGREIGKIIVNGKDVNLEQIQRGMAWVYRQYLRELSKEDRDLYDRAEAVARSAQHGLWIYASPVPPWDFRKTNRPE